MRDLLLKTRALLPAAACVTGAAASEFSHLTAPATSHVTATLTKGAL